MPFHEPNPLDLLLEEAEGAAGPGPPLVVLGQAKSSALK